MKLFCGFTCTAASVCLLAALAAGARDAAPAKRAVLKVSLSATVTKTWNTVTDTTLGGCDVSIHSIGARKVVLKSARPTRVVVTSSGGRVAYSPSAVRFVRIEVSGSGSEATRFKAPCKEQTVKNDCRRAHRVLTGGALRFFRSKRNEISFHRARLPEVAGTCPWQSAQLRAIRPGLHQAEGELVEAALTNPRIAGQTASASAEVDSEFDEDEVGRASERVRWSLSFSRYPTGSPQR
jgi:hypothetical protein